MSGRYSGWRKLQGDTADRPDLLDLGKKMLAYLDNQRRLSGVSTMAQYRELPDGSVVMARWVGNLPEIYVKGGGGQKPAWWAGFAFRPTTEPEGRQSWAGGTGTGAYEIANYRMQTLLLRPNGSGTTEFLPAWYDETALWWPGDPAPARYYRPQLGDGAFRYAANLDWTGNAGVLHFFGPAHRLSDFWWQFDAFVLHNGQKLLDLNNSTGVTFSNYETYGRQVLGCALAGSIEAPQLRVAVGERDNEDSLEMVIRIVTCALIWRGGRLAAVSNDSGEAILTDRGSYTVTHMSGQTACMFWNQAGDECRTLMPRFDDADNEVNRYSEIVATRTSGGGFTISEVATHVVPPIEGFIDPVQYTGSISLTTGSLQSAYGSNVFPDSGSGVSPVYAAMSYSQGYVAQEWFKISVDYRDNVPVYLEHRRLNGLNEGSAERSRTVLASYPGESQTSGYEGLPIQLSYAVDTFAHWEVPSASPEPWLPSATVESAATGTAVHSFSESYRTDFIQLDAVDEGTTTTHNTREITTTGNYWGNEVTTERNERSLSSDILLFRFVDLRNKIIVYRRQTRTLTSDRTVTETRDYGPTGDPDEFSKRVEWTGPSVDTTDWWTVFTCNGIEIESALSNTQTTTATDTDVTYTVASGWGFWWHESSMYDRLLSIDVGVSSQPIPSEPEGEYILPGVGWAFHAGDYSLNPINRSIGSWPRSGDLIAYEYPVKDGLSTEFTATAADFVRGFCTADGVKLTLDMTALLFDGVTAETEIRHFPILAISPFPSSP